MTKKNTIKLLLTSFILILICKTNTAQTNQVKLNIATLNTDKGHVLVALFNNSNGFPEDATKAYKTAKIKSAKGTRTILINDIPPGQYAVAVFHDSNDDGKMNKNMLGIPKEGYGVSNNVKNLMSAPTFKEAKFSHKAFTELNIDVNY